MNVQLTSCIFASLLAHATLLFWIEDRSQLELEIGGQAQALRVTLISHQSTPLAGAESAEPETAAIAQAPMPLPVIADSKPAPTRTKQQQPAVQTTATQQTRSSPHSEPTTAALTQPPHQVSATNVSERISAALQNQLSKRFEYPWLARKRGWQGMVTLSLKIHDNGDLTHWRISKTSGYSLLDRSALKAARAIGRLQEADELLDGESLNLFIPVRYQLLDS
jgi:protein TonB